MIRIRSFHYLVDDMPKGAEAAGLGPPPFDEKRKIENPSFFSVYLWAFPV